MKILFFSSIALLSVSAVFAQNSVVVSQTGDTQHVSINQQGGGQSAVVMQSGGLSGNRASITQSGGGGLVRIEQHGTDSSEGASNRVSLQVEKGTQTTIDQQSSGSNAVEISREGLPTAKITQSSAIDRNSITVLPDPQSVNRRERPAKRHNRRP
jgi:hypothetical protein